jgi:putative transposase
MIVGESEERSQQTLCRLLGYSRQAYNKRERREEREAIKAEFVIREVVKIREVQRRLGTRKLYHMTQPFCLEHGIKMGRDRFNELLRDNALLVRKRRQKKPRTTFSGHWKRYPNLIREYVPSASNQVWVSDITYVRSGEGFAYLSLITDAYSRKIVGYRLSRNLSAKGCVAALRMALRNNPDRDGLIHHSDRGLQYYSAAYMKLLGPRIRISMTEKSDPLENAIAERVNGILKDELLEKRLGNFNEAREKVDQAVNTYNHLRPHLSIDMLTPAEAHNRTGELKRRWKNYFSTMPTAQAMA